MPDFERILVAYEDRQTQVVDDLVAELDASPEERARLRLVAQLVQSMIHTFGTFEADRDLVPEAGDLEERRPLLATSAAAEPQAGQIPDLSLRSLVDSGCPTVWQARDITLSLGLKRNMFISGEPGAGKSTLLNALVGQLPDNQRLVVIDEQEDALPSIGGRAEVSQIVAGAGHRTRAAAFRKAADTKADWIVVGELALGEVPAFLDALQGGSSGLVTITAAEPGALLDHPLVANRKTAHHLGRVKPLVLHLQKERDGMPRILDMLEVTMRGDAAVLSPQTGLG